MPVPQLPNPTPFFLVDRATVKKVLYCKREGSVFRHTCYYGINHVTVVYEWTILIEGEDTPITFKSQDGSVKEGREIGVYKGHNGEYVWRVIPNLSPDDHLFE